MNHPGSTFQYSQTLGAEDIVEQGGLKAVLGWSCPHLTQVLVQVACLRVLRGGLAAGGLLCTVKKSSSCSALEVVGGRPWLIHIFIFPGAI